MNNEYIFVDTSTALIHLCDRLAGSPWLAVDTEFERERTYYPELCLLQIANTQVTAIIDPLAIADMQPVYTLLYDTAITKVFHSARQDLEIFFHLHGKVPVPLYDTQLAAETAGYDSSIGYANLVEKMLNVTLDKAHTRTDWKRRPLKPTHLRYAADDVIYLGLLYPSLLALTGDGKKADTLRTEFDKLTDPDLYVPPPGQMWKKIRESRHMHGPALAVLQALAAWRELTAREENRPRKWVMPDPVLATIARQRPATVQELTQIKGLPVELPQRHITALLALVGKHCNKPPGPHSEA